MDFAARQIKGISLKDILDGELGELNILTDCDVIVETRPRMVRIISLRHSCKVCGSSKDLDEVMPLCRSCLEKAKSREV